MRIAIVGAGNVGRSVGRAWAESGHRVRYGVRDPARVTDLPDVARVAEAVADAEVVVLSVMFHAAEAALRDCGDLAGRILLDPTNPLAPDEGGLKLALGFDSSAAEFIAARIRAPVVKSLNQVGAAVLGNARVYRPRPIQFVAGDDARAKASVASLVEDLGFDVRDAGPLKAARLLEPMAMVWIDQAMRYGMEPTRAWALVDAQASR